MKDSKGLSYYSDDIICKFKVPITCGIKKTLHCFGGRVDLNSSRLLDSCGCNLLSLDFEYGYKVYISDACKVTRIPMSGHELLLFGMQIDINRCSADDLLSIEGVGEVTAAKIISLREEMGKFNRIEDLMRIKGIGKKMLNNLSRYLCIDCME